MAKDKRAARQWAANAIVMAGRITAIGNLLLIARQHLEKAEKAERSAGRRSHNGGTIGRAVQRAAR
jgi:hypothetical protein